MRQNSVLAPPDTDIVLFRQGVAPQRYTLSAGHVDALLSFLGMAHAPSRRPTSAGEWPFNIAPAPQLPLGAAYLVAQRHRARLSQHQLARICHMRPHHICLIERGKRGLGKVVAKRLAWHLDCDWERLLTPDPSAKRS